MSEAKTLAGMSAKMNSDFDGFENIKAGATMTAVVGYEHLTSLCIDRKLRRAPTRQLSGYIKLRYTPR